VSAWRPWAASLRHSTFNFGDGSVLLLKQPLSKGGASVRLRSMMREAARREDAEGDYPRVSARLIPSRRLMARNKSSQSYRISKDVDLIHNTPRKRKRYATFRLVESFQGWFYNGFELKRADTFELRD
jgi:hypothetical protein